PIAGLALCTCISFFSGCDTPAHGPDKTLAGATLGGGWGAGAGAIIGNQVSNVGAGTAIGAGFGVAAGALSGAAYDLIESDMKQQEGELAQLRAQNLANGAQLQNLQTTLDRLASSPGGFGIFQVFFDVDVTSLKSGAIANLEVIAESIKGDPHATQVMVVGHADDSGSPEYNQQLSEARAREVSSYLMRRGISRDQIKVKGVGSSNPIASNSSPVGRQLNRRVDIYIGKE
ncbi:MAG: OmpA family protein, partial [SAR324 cluster bacterium]|nr:OmpA family protein [SAR324 cluster bacterium]